jgi:sugar-specific transcriptional regulator TrmB
MDIKPILQQFGLSGRKADVYLAALELGSSPVIEIAKKAQIKRTTCYDILQDLISEGLVSETAKGKKRLFVGEDPQKIQRDLKRKEQIFSDILPELQSVYNVKGGKPKIRFYEGKAGLAEVYEDTLKYSGEILAFASYDVVKVLGKNWTDDYIARRVKKGIAYRALIPNTPQVVSEFISKDPQQKRVSKLIDPKKYPFSIEINIYGHQKVALISSKEETGIIIEGFEIHNTFKLIFELAWNLVEK